MAKIMATYQKQPSTFKYGGDILKKLPYKRSFHVQVLSNDKDEKTWHELGAGEYESRRFHLIVSPTKKILFDDTGYTDEAAETEQREADE